MSKKWNDFWFGLADYISTKSKDKSRKVGAVIVGSADNILATGWNGFCRGVNDDVQSRHERPIKYLYSEHAERNAIYNAAREGVRLENSTMYSKWFPCSDCARAIIQSGIAKLVTTIPDWEDFTWGSQFKVSKEMLDEAGVEIDFQGEFKEKAK